MSQEETLRKITDRSNDRSIPPPLISRIFLCWVWPIILQVRRRGKILPDEIPQLWRDFKCEHVAQMIDKEVKNRGDAEEISVLRLLWRLNSHLLIPGWILSAILGLVMSIGRPLVLRWLLQALNDDLDISEIWYTRILLVPLIILIEGFCWTSATQFLNNTLSTRMVCALSTLVLRKTGNLAANGQGHEKSLVAIDIIGKISAMMWVLVFIPSSITGIIGGYAVLITIVGPSASMAGLCISLLGIGFNLVCARRSKRFEARAIAFASSRVSMLSELISSIHGVKCFAWEVKVLNKLNSIRDSEVGCYKNYHRARVMGSNTGRCLPILSACATFMTYALMGEILKSEIIFPSLAIFHGMRMSFVLIPLNLVNCKSILLSISRVQDYLKLIDKENSPVSSKIDRPSNTDSTGSSSLHKNVDIGNCVIEMSSASFAFPNNRNTPVLPIINNVNLKLAPGTVTAIIGPVGCGKTALLQAIVGEMVCTSSDKLDYNPCRIGYVQQTSFVASGSIRENILMGRVFDQTMFDQVVWESCLNSDVDSLTLGFDTEIGERGVTLSGGQQQRLNLARAIYGNPELVVFDDPLSALDAAVASRVFERAIMDRSRSSKTAMVIAINQLHLLESIDEVLVLDVAGETVYYGSPKDTMLFHKYFLNRSKQDSISFERPINREVSKETQSLEDILSKIEIESLGCSQDVVEPVQLQQVESSLRVNKVVRQDQSHVGRINRELLKKYIRNMGTMRLIFFFIVVLFAYCFYGANDMWLSYWVSQSVEEQEDNAIRDTLIYLALSLIHTVLTTFAGYILFSCLAVAGKSIHNESLYSLLRGSMAYFNETLSGRIISRFSSDLGGVDTFFSSLLEVCSQFSFLVFTMFLIQMIIIPPIIPFIFIILMLYMFEILTVETANRDTKRLANLSSRCIFQDLYACFYSVVMTNVSELSNSCVLMRVMGLKSYFLERHFKFVDEYNRFFFASTSVISWSTLTCFIIGASINTCTVLLVFSPFIRDTVSIELSSLVLTLSLLVPGLLNLVSQFFCQINLGLTQVERVMELAVSDGQNSVTPEADWYHDDDPEVVYNSNEPLECSDNYWPNDASIEFCQATLKYKEDLTPAVKAIDLKVEAGQKIGVCGRTGAGKSSILNLLLRLYEASNGTIMISNRDIKSLGLHTLRKSIAYVPQEPLVLQGSLRYNLDSFNEYTDDEITDALVKTGIGHLSLNLEISTKGDSISAGEKQLLSFARMLLRKCKIIAMDEPSSNMDLETDQTIQNLLRTELINCTVLCVAHRVQTVLNYDRIVVLQDGKIAEYGLPEDLLADPDSIFRGMVDSGS